MLEWVRGICEGDAVNSHVTINKRSVHHHSEVKIRTISSAHLSELMQHPHSSTNPKSIVFCLEFDPKHLASETNLSDFNVTHFVSKYSSDSTVT